MSSLLMFTFVKWPLILSSNFSNVSNHSEGSAIQEVRDFES